MDPVPDPLLLRKSGSAGNRTRDISFDASLVMYINCTNIPPIMIINRIYETRNLLSL